MSSLKSRYAASTTDGLQAPCARAGAEGAATPDRPNGRRRERAAPEAPARAHQQFDHCALEPMPRGLRIVRRRRRRWAQLGQESRDLGTAGAEAGVERVWVRLADEEPQRLDERLIGRADDCLGAPVEDERAALRRFAAELAQKPRLACAGLAGEQRDGRPRRPRLVRAACAGSASSLARPTNGNGESGTERPGQRRRVRRPRRAGRARGRARVLREDLPLEPPQLGARLDPELVERGARVAGRPRAPPPAGPSGRARASAARAGARDADARRSAPPARRSARRGGRARDPPRSAPRSPPAASPPGDRSRRCANASSELGERRPAPQRQRLRNSRGRCAAGSLSAASATRRSKRSTSTRSGSTCEHVAGRPRQQRVRQAAPCAGARRNLHVRDGRRRRLLAPELVDQSLARDDPIRVQQQQSQQGPLLRAPEGKRPIFHPYLQRTQDPVVHSASFSAPFSARLVAFK